MDLLARLKKPSGETSSTFTPGVYHFDRQRENGDRARVHLRVNPDLSGALLINAARVFALNPSAALMSFLALNNHSANSGKAVFRQYFQGMVEDFESTYNNHCQQLDQLIFSDGSCPICDFDLEVKTPFSASLTAPYRMDLALTYRCNNDCSHCYNARPRNFPELNEADWHTIIDRCWKEGIPHLVFTGGEPTLRNDLTNLIRHAEKNGQITGINTNGRRLADKRYVEELKAAGLDHIQITLESHRSEIHDHMVQAKNAWEETTEGIRNAVASGLFIMTNTTLLRSNAPYLEDMLHFLGSLGVPTIGLNALIYSGKGAASDAGLSETELHPLLDIAREITGRYGQKLIWYTPTQYCHFDPVEAGFGVKGCTAAYTNMCVEPNGQVIPCQSYYQPLGQILIDPWEKIWNAPLAQSIRNREYAADECKHCAIFDVCGGGCPLARDHFSPQAVMEKSWC